MPVRRDNLHAQSSQLCFDFRKRFFSIELDVDNDASGSVGHDRRGCAQSLLKLDLIALEYFHELPQAETQIFRDDGGRQGWGWRRGLRTHCDHGGESAGAKDKSVHRLGSEAGSGKDLVSHSSDGKTGSDLARFARAGPQFRGADFCDAFGCAGRTKVQI
jgi:hypothetical protein